MALESYRKKRDFGKTTEPAGGERPSAHGALTFVVQKHAARALHYDFRLELDGVLVSWAVPKGPSLDPHDKRLAVHVEDHPLEYGGFEGVIPPGEYGAGTVILWDRGTWRPLGDAHAGLERGDFKFELFGEKLRGTYVLARMKPREGERAENWLLIKERDAEAVPQDGARPLRERPESVLSGHTIEEVAADPDAQWHTEGPEAGLAMAPAGGGTRTARGTAPDPSTLPGARRGALPRTLEPELATLVKTTPEGEGWLHEIKFDGYRAFARLELGTARMLSRRGKDWTDRFRSLADAVEALPVKSALIDGEVVVLDDRGVSSFQRLQEDLSAKRADRLVYFAFDLLHLDGYDVSGVPLTGRKELLKALLDAGPAGSPIRLAEDVAGGGTTFRDQACALGLEGVVSKRGDSAYRAGRGRDWLKSKCLLSQEFVVVGWTDPAGSRSGFGALLLGVHRDSALRYAGRVGTGFTERSLRELSTRLSKLSRDTSPLDAELPARERRGVHWVTPELVAEVAFAEWTGAAHLRHPSFKGIREDKRAAEVVAELPVEQPVPDPPAGKDVALVLGVRMTHPGKRLYPADGLTKRGLADYYQLVSEHMVPYADGRPIAMLRCPDGLDGGCFFYKHAEDAPPALDRLIITESGGPATYLAAHDLAGLVSLVQMDVLEVHTWGCRSTDIEHPDRIVFDLDPDEGVEWTRVVEAGRLVRQLLDGLDLVSFPKLTGGKGLHVVVPLAPSRDWPAVSRFAHAVAEGIVRISPDRYTANMRKDRRGGRVFVDYLRNARGATAVEVYSTRAKPGAPVAVPVRWDELGARMPSNAYSVRTVGRRLAALRADPWDGYAEVAQEITRAMERDLGIR